MTKKKTSKDYVVDDSVSEERVKERNKFDFGGFTIFEIPKNKNTKKN